MSVPSQMTGRPAGILSQSSSGGQSKGAPMYPLHHRANGSPHPTHAADSYTHSIQAEWTSWQELSVKISDLPPSTTTRDLWRCFNGQGTITMIEIYENQGGQRDGKATVRFRYAYL